ncbi:MFS transporter [Halosquirtibacter xylanolyticus]|uniref:MFS transporter n=1 Tax=Halosquirtibacter xylanolyticus TaxID=3374599 RepID=UPI00374A37C8|nr:MFS transporter [Prolixibacteraceae bacterium]
MNTVQKSLRDSAVARWSALLIVSITMFCGYFFTDVMSPLKPLLEKDLGWTSGDYGWFTSAYGWFNVFFGMLFIGGIILDKFGARIAGLLASGLMVVGASIKYWAVASEFPEGAMLLGHSKQVAFAALGFAIFGTGVEIMGITVSKILVRWFKGYEMALAMGLQVAVARIGTMLAMAAPLRIVDHFGTISSPLAFCLVLLIIGFLSYFIYIVMDKKLEASIEVEKDEASDEGFSFKDLGAIFANRGFWYIALLCVLFYSSVFPFLKYATDFFINKFAMTPEDAGDLPGLLPLGTLFLTPIFGGIYDKLGKGATMMIIGSVLLVFIHGLFAMEGLTSVPVAITLVVLLGVALSLVPSAMWPSVAKIIPEKQLGTAFSMIFWVQNWGLMGVPLLIGYVLEKYCISSEPGADVVTYNYNLPMTIFMCFGILAVVFAVLLKNADRKKGYGLELPNDKH